MARSSPALRARRLARRLAALQRVSAVLATVTDADEVSRLTLETAVGVLGAEAGSLLLHDPNRRVLRFRHVVGATPEIEASLRGLELPDTAGLSGRVMRTRRGLIVADAAHEKGHNRTVDARTEYRTRGLLAAPLTSPGGRVLGVLEVLNARDRAFDRDDLGVLCLLAAQAGTALETARLHRAAALASVAHRIGDMSHDVKNLLTPVGTGVQTLRMLLEDTFLAADAAPPPPGSPLAAALAELRSMAPELTGLALSGVTDVQERVREIADAVKGIVSTPVFEATDLRALVQAVARVLYPVADPAGVALDLSGVQALPPIVVDRRRIYNCLYNLIHNAIPETPPGGTVWVSARRIVDDGAPDRLELVVRDDGRGMTEQVRARLFGDDALSTKPGGTGLGTRIVRGAVEAHGGTVHVASAPGAGARFTLSIPWKSPP
jgi:signal transduction histidine kinase